MQKVIETRTGWMIRCMAHGADRSGWHEFPKVGKPKATWTFNGNLECPTFRPSMNEHCNPPGPHHNPEVPESRCHFVVENGMINYQGDCSHDLRGKTMELEPWSDATVEYYAALKQAEGW